MCLTWIRRTFWPKNTEIRHRNRLPMRVLGKHRKCLHEKKSIWIKTEPNRYANIHALRACYEKIALCLIGTTFIVNKKKVPPGRPTSGSQWYQATNWPSRNCLYLYVHKLIGYISNYLPEVDNYNGYITFEIPTAGSRALNKHKTFCKELKKKNDGQKFRRCCQICGNQVYVSVEIFRYIQVYVNAVLPDLKRFASRLHKYTLYAYTTTYCFLTKTKSFRESTTNPKCSKVWSANFL